MYYQYDALGNVTDMTDHLGEDIAKYRFDAFGGMFAGPLAPYSFQGITGKEYDPKSGLMFYNSRWYDPKVGRFTQADTFKGVQSQPGTQHPYAYVGNNPINNLDPTGHTPRDSWGTDVDGNDVGSDHYGDQSGSWNNYGEFEPDGGSSGGGGGSSGGGGSHTPTPEERKGQYNQTSQSVPTMFKGLYSTLTQKVNKNMSMQAAPGVWNYSWDKKYASSVIPQAPQPEKSIWDKKASDFGYNWNNKYAIGVSKALSTVGDALQVVGTAAVFTGVGAPLGGTVAFVGTSLSILGNLGSFANNDITVKQVAKGLAPTGVFKAARMVSGILKGGGAVLNYLDHVVSKSMFAYGVADNISSRYSKPPKPVGVGDLKKIESNSNKPKKGIGDLKRSEYRTPNSSRSKNISMADLKRM